MSFFNGTKNVYTSAELRQRRTQKAASIFSPARPTLTQRVLAAPHRGFVSPVRSVPAPGTAPPPRFDGGGFTLRQDFPTPTPVRAGTAPPPGAPFGNVRRYSLNRSRQIYVRPTTSTFAAGEAKNTTQL